MNAFHEYFSMNVMIPQAQSHTEKKGTNAVGGLCEAEATSVQEKGVKLVWYSLTPYCLFNPVTHGLDSKSCACADGLLSVAPNGEILPCSSFERGIGNLLQHPFEKLWYSSQARYWREKHFIPPACHRCAMRHICCGACPLYWDAHGGFAELSGVAPGAGRLDTLDWKVRRRLHGQARGVGLS